MKAAEANIEKSTMLLNMGFIAESELNSIKLQKINTQLSLQQQKQQLRQTLNELKVNLGLSVNDSVKLTPDLSNSDAAALVLEKIRKNRPQHKAMSLYDALTRSSTLIGDRITLRSYERQMKIYYQGKNVTLDANGSLSWDTSSGTGSSNAGLTFSLPLDNRSTNNSIQTQKLDIINSQQQFMRDCIDLIRQESDGFDNMIYNYDQTLLSNEQLDISRKVDESSKIQFKYGQISASDVQSNHQDYLSAINNLRQAENAYTDSVSAYRQLTNRFIDNMPVDLTPELNLIFQTVKLPDNKRHITGPRLVIPPKDVQTEQPYKLCYKLMHADIANM